MKKTPLLPRSCPSPLGGVGARHSRWSWMSPNDCRVMIDPVPGATSIAPSTIVHGAGLSVVSASRQASRDAPPNSTIASDGAPALAIAPGVTTVGLGRIRECWGHSLGSLGTGLGLACAAAVVVARSRATATAAKRGMGSSARGRLGRLAPPFHLRYNAPEGLARAGATGRVRGTHGRHARGPE